MIAGQTAYLNGYQIMLFPLDYLNCSQTYGINSYSHCCNKATDWVGTYTRYPYYAPCDCIQLSNGAGTSDHICTYRSVNQVVTPSGLKYVSFCFMHDDNPPTFSGTISQGTLIGHTGNAGLSTGEHVHIDQCEGNTFTLVSAGYGCTVGGTCFYPQHELEPTQTYYLTGDETIASTGGLSFLTTDKATIPSDYKWYLYPNKRKKMRKWGVIW